jgi:Domain of unknown function (DUF4157)
MSTEKALNPAQKAQKPVKGAAEGPAVSPLLKVRPFAEAGVKVEGGEQRDLFGEYVQRRAMAAAAAGGGALGSGGNGGGENRAGMPDGLKTGLKGFSGQDVKSPMQMKKGVPVNDDEGLEREADSMGANHGSVKLSPQPREQRPNKTGLPDNLKAGVESLSGLSMDHVKVHYNSSQPAQLNALAYAQGSDIHVAPGQERHLPHEAWHVVQQAQGRVKPTMQMKDGVPVNDDAGLEREADVMRERALAVVSSTRQLKKPAQSTYVNWTRSYQRRYGIGSDGVVQGIFDKESVTGDIAFATSIKRAGGTTGEAYLVDTSGEHEQIFIKFTDDAFAVEGAALAERYGIATPKAIEIDKESISAKISELDPEAGKTLASKKHAIAFEYVSGESASDKSKGNFNQDSYRQMGEIAAFDMLIGKTDLFENFEQYNEEQENYNNIKVNGPKLVDIDLSASAFTKERLRVIRAIVDDPTTINSFVESKVGRLFELKKDRLSYLQIQKGFLRMVASVSPDDALDITNGDVNKTILEFAEIAPDARDAIKTVDEAIREEEGRRERQLEQASQGERLAAEEREPIRQRQVEQAQSGCCCYLTTACCQYYGMRDDCEYLMVLREFRDEWLLKQPGGLHLVKEYYDKAPALIVAIGRRHDEDELYALILEGIKIAVSLVSKNEMKRAAVFYQNMSLSLERLCAPSVRRE